MYFRVIISALFFTTYLNAQTYLFINSTTGDDDSGDGSFSLPYKTFHKGYSEATAGDTLDLTGVFDWSTPDESGDVATNGYYLTKSLVLIGNGVNNTIFQAATDLTSSDRAIFFIEDSIKLDIFKTAFRYGKNIPNGLGGAMHINSKANIFIEDCHFYENESAFSGGAIFIYNGASVNIWSCTFNDNSSTDGAALFMDGSELYLKNSTFTQNICKGSGVGGGLLVENNSITAYVTNCTFTRNSSTLAGSGVKLTNADISFKNNIIANNLNSDFYVTGAQATDAGYNLVESSDHQVWNGTGSITGEQVNLNIDSVLAINNAPNAVPTLKLLSGSVAIDAGNSSDHDWVSIPMQDQRGALRNGTVDMGAYEFWDNDGSLPVALTAFKATALKSSIKIEWETASELNNAAFILERKTEGQNFRQIAKIKGAGNSSSTNFYQIIDSTLMAGATYFYRLSDIDFSGKRTYQAHILSTALNNSTLPQAVELYNNYPNPFNPLTTISFSIPSSIKSDTKLFIYNVLGEIVRGHNFGILNPGLHSYKWDTRNNIGQLLPSGIYFYSLKLNGKQFTKKMTLIR